MRGTGRGRVLLRDGGGEDRSPDELSPWLKAMPLLLLLLLLPG